MALMTRLRSLCVVERYFSINSVIKNNFHILRRTPPRLHHKPNPSILTRTFLFRRPSQRDLKIKDDVPDSFALIYRNTMDKYILTAQIVSLVTGGFIILAFILKEDFANYKNSSHEWSPTTKAVENEGFYYMTAFMLILVLLQAMVSRMPLRIYKIPQTPKYITVNYGNYFFGKEKFTFNRGEIFHMPETGILPWKADKYLVETKTSRRMLILLDQYFRRPADLSIMLGEQKDPDLDE